jgi:hypothetical protein
VPILTTLECTPKSLLYTDGYEEQLLSEQHSMRLYLINIIKMISYSSMTVNATAE